MEGPGKQDPTKKSWVQCITSWKHGSNKEIYQNVQRITETEKVFEKERKKEKTKRIRKKRGLTILGYQYRMNKNRPTKHVFDYLWNKKTTTAWIKEGCKDLEKLYHLGGPNVRKRHVSEQNSKVRLISSYKAKTRRVWTGEQRLQVSECMDE